MTLPLSNLLVISLEQAVAAPMCSCRLADAGARVIKIERPEGDFARYYDQLARSESAYFVWLNRGKESVCLDLMRANDKALLSALLAKADAFRTSSQAPSQSSGSPSTDCTVNIPGSSSARFQATASAALIRRARRMTC